MCPLEWPPLSPTTQDALVLSVTASDRSPTGETGPKAPVVSVHLYPTCGIAVMHRLSPGFGMALQRSAAMVS